MGGEGLGLKVGERVSLGQPAFPWRSAPSQTPNAFGDCVCPRTPCRWERGALISSWVGTGVFWQRERRVPPKKIRRGRAWPKVQRPEPRMGGHTAYNLGVRQAVEMEWINGDLTFEISDAPDVPAKYAERREWMRFKKHRTSNAEREKAEASVSCASFCGGMDCGDYGAVFEI